MKINIIEETLIQRIFGQINHRKRIPKNTNAQQAITFLIPPEMGKMHSGAKALVELSSVGELSVARYALN